MFEQAQCKHPFIVLKDIKCDDLESLLSYMYVGEVNVVQEKLSGLIKAAECLKIKGLAVLDEEPTPTKISKRPSDNSIHSEPKRRRQDDTNNSSSSTIRQSINRSEDRRKSSDQSPSNKFRNSTVNSRDTSIENSYSKESRPPPSPSLPDRPLEVKSEEFENSEDAVSIFIH
jgi:hypothetical protein